LNKRNYLVVLSLRNMNNIENILKISGASLDFKYISEWTEKGELTSIWKNILSDYEKFRK